MHLPGSRRFFEPQCATSHRHNDIVVGVDVVSGICTRREAPLGNRYTVIFDLYFGGRFHNTFCDRDRRRAMWLLSSTRHDIITIAMLTGARVLRPGSTRRLRPQRKTER